MKKSILIIGMGRLGSHLAEKLQDLGHDIMILDSKEERIARLASRFADARIAEYT
ncbi:MAG: NAD-binding protein, partial [Clostridia bacterium]|nr:NAD-binding protein [Clostridia bacterium]